MYEYERFSGASWITVAESEYHRTKHYRHSIDVAYFRKVFNLEEKGKMLIDISGNSRYRLWINGKDILSGPLKGDRWRRYFETVDISDYLKPGKNLMAVKVVSYLPYEGQKAEEKSPYWLIGNTAGPCLMVSGKCYNYQGDILADITTGKTDWEAKLDEAVSWKHFSLSHWMGSMEVVAGSKIPVGWNTGIEPISQWEKSVIKFSIDRSPFGIIDPLPLVERSIPLLFENKKEFSREMNLYDDKFKMVSFDDDGRAKIPVNAKMAFELDAGELTTSYIKLKLSGGRGSQVMITYAESYTGVDSETGRRVKGKRNDNRNMEIYGHYDTYFPSGKEEVYQPFWFRTFRFIRVEIETGEEELTIFKPQHIETGYPLNPESEFRSETALWTEDIWEMAIRTLQRCMHETYEDCPYYEQLQYVADTRLQMLFNYMVSGDYKLAAKGIKDFHYSLLPEGIIQARYPTCEPHVIPQWSAHWIFMIEDYYWQTGDKNWINQYLPTIDAVLNWYDSKIGDSGLVEDLGYWDQVDWIDEWERGVSPASALGPSTVQNLVYANVLLSGANVNQISGRKGIAVEYTDRAKAIYENVRKLCWSEDLQMFREGPECYEYSQHAQMWAVLTGFMDHDKAEIVMTNALENPETRKCTYPFLFYFFRALEKVGKYEKTKQYWDMWKIFLDVNLTTLPETPDETPRSDCHAWSALPLYEFTRKFLGIKPMVPGWEKIIIEPICNYIDNAQGKVITPKGMVEVEWQQKGREFVISGNLPEGIAAEIRLPEGTIESLPVGGSFKYKVCL